MMTTDVFCRECDIDTIETRIPMLSYNEDEELEDDWDDDDDEVFDDLAADREDLHDIILENNIDDPEDDDHLPEEDAD